MMKAGCRIFQSFFSIVIKGIGEGKQEVCAKEGALGEVKDMMAQAGKSRPLIVTGQRVSKTDFFKKLTEDLPDAVVFAEVTPDPTTECVRRIASVYKEKNCDSLIAIGGGSNMDAAKAAGALIVRPGVSVRSLGGLLKVRKKLPFFIAVPTTAGTGSECTVAAVITDETAGRKYAINDPALLPDVAVLDPALTCTLPPNLTAWTGMDALTHAVEAYLNKAYHLKNTKRLCEEAVASIIRWLPVAFHEPDHMEARRELLLASYKAGRAFTTACVGNVHALAHTLGGQYHIPHGKANAALLPVVLSAYGEKVYAPLAHLACVAHLTDGDELHNDIYEEERQAKDFIRHIRQMNASFGIAPVFPELKEADIPRMAAWAAREANPLYPVPVIFSKWEMEEILASVREGSQEPV